MTAPTLPPPAPPSGLKGLEEESADAQYLLAPKSHILMVTSAFTSMLAGFRSLLKDYNGAVLVLGYNGVDYAVLGGGRE